ncbi:MAG TPA: DUF1800 domain-containing protein [Verrucomicrobiales bacterium]|nr:DUF1800 domain-containing protein [Verrucomicrobiales bacterium]
MNSRSTRRAFLRLAGGAGALTLASCGKLKEFVSALPIGPRPDALVPFQPPSGQGVDLITHVLNRLTWGIPPGEYQRVRALASTEEEAFRLFVDEQLDPDKIEDRFTHAALAPLEAIREPVAELYEYKPAQLNDELTRQAVIRAVHSRRQLYEVMVGFWTDHFNIDASKLDCRWFKTVDDRAVIRPHALGNFRDLLKASALSPAMLFYLDGRENRKRHDSEKPNENYARELLELHTLGVHGGYTQRDVMEAARCLTGWTVSGREVRNSLNIFDGKPHVPGRVFFENGAHDDGPKTVLGVTIPAGGGASDLDRLLDILTQHPSTADFIALKLCRHFIADDPPRPAVQAVADVFQKSRGDNKETLRSLFLTPEFAAARGCRIKRPFHFIVSSLRATGTVTQCGSGVQRSLTVMGHAPFHYPTPEGPAPDGASWLSTLLHRWDFAARLTSGEFSCSRIDTGKLMACAGGREPLLRHLMGRQPDSGELAAAASVQDPVALGLCSPAFQMF